jgi:NAD(P)-dependent dehydrogenase (short-subunit alcohol dehydrogenase family)
MPCASVYRSDLFQGKAILITGGNGLGRCMVHELTWLGASVVLVGRSLDKLKLVAVEIAEDGGRASIHTCGIRAEVAVSSTVAAVLEAHGRIDGLGWPGSAHSGAARAEMLSFTESAATEWARSGVRVNAVAPGWVASSEWTNIRRKHRQCFDNYVIASRLSALVPRRKSQLQSAFCYSWLLDLQWAPIPALMAGYPTLGGFGISRTI